MTGHILWRVAPGAVLTAIGAAAAAYVALHYRIGSISSIGPGMFPFGLGLLLAGFGALMSLEALRPAAGPGIEKPPVLIGPALAVFVGVALFALLIDRAGMLPATAALTLCSGLASGRFDVRRSLVVFVVLSLVALLLFRMTLGIHVPMIRGIW